MHYAKSARLILLPQFPLGLSVHNVRIYHSHPSHLLPFGDTISVTVVVVVIVITAAFFVNDRDIENGSCWDSWE